MDTVASTNYVSLSDQDFDIRSEMFLIQSF